MDTQAHNLSIFSYLKIGTLKHPWVLYQVLPAVTLVNLNSLQNGWQIIHDWINYGWRFFFPHGGLLVNKDSKVLAAERAKPKICAFLPFRPLSKSRLSGKDSLKAAFRIWPMHSAVGDPLNSAQGIARKAILKHRASPSTQGGDHTSTCYQAGWSLW